MHLAWRCGFPHADHLLRTIDSRQYNDIVAMRDVEPIGVEREDLRDATLAALLTHGKVQPQAFLDGWSYRPPPKPLTRDEVAANVNQVFAALAANFKETPAPCPPSKA